MLALFSSMLVCVIQSMCPSVAVRVGMEVGGRVQDFVYVNSKCEI